MCSSVLLDGAYDGASFHAIKQRNEFHGTRPVVEIFNLLLMLQVVNIIQFLKYVLFVYKSKQLKKKRVIA